ncbi:MAG: C69 family dipeptidase [Candidatus Dojkabacteria bacterium]|jgi:secernin
MCDTLWKKQNQYSIFLKNSDRAVNEPNLTIFYPAGTSRGQVQCTYISIPDPKEHYAVLLVKPSWIWGAEMGTNQYGVSIGNEAVFTKSKTKKTPTLIGMDFLRLALERSQTAKQATEEIIQLLQQYGQGGNCGFDNEFYYDNSYLITDTNEAYILETAGKEYALKQVKDCANISNRLSLDEFAKKHTEPIFTYFSGSKSRMKLGSQHLKNIQQYDLEQYFNTLRLHTTTQEKAIRKGSVKSVCMHAGLLGDHTTGSMISIVNDKDITIWTTGSSTPCISIFKPLYFHPSGNFVVPPCFKNEQDSFQYWLKREKLNRLIYSNIINLDELTQKARKLEQEFIKGDKQLKQENTSHSKLVQFSLECSKKEENLVSQYAELINNFDNCKLTRYWSNKSKQLGKNVFERELCKRKK